MAEDYASASLPRHLVRGLIGFGSLVAAVVGVVLGWWPTLLLLPVGLVALRGCPMCWAIGLLRTLSAGRLRRECRDGRCRLSTAAAPKTG